MRIRKSLVGMAVAVGMLTAAGSASAATTTVNLLNTGVLFGVTSVSTPDRTDGAYLGLSVTQTARGENLGNPASTTTTNMSIQCGGVASAAAGTGVRQCYLLGLNNGVHYNAINTGAKPGAADAQVGASLSVPLQPYASCVQTRALLRDNTFYDAPLVCSTS